MSVEEETKKPYRGFNEAGDLYYINDVQWKIKKVNGRQQKELATVRKEIIKQHNESDDLIADELLDKQDDWTKDVLETYFDGFIYDEQLDNYDLVTLRQIAGEVYGFLSVMGTNLQERELLMKRYGEIQKSSKTIQT